MMQASSEKLVAEFLERRSKNTRYSERAFAKSAGLSPGFLKLLFQGKRALSVTKAREVANRLGWTDLKADTFLISVRQERLARMGRPPTDCHEIEHFAEISDWYHFAIVELLKINRRISVKEIADRLNISTTEAQFSLRALERHGLIKLQDGMPEAAISYLVPTMSSSAIRKFHAQMLAKAQASLETQPIQIREVRSLTLAFETRKKAEATAMIKDFMKRFEKRFSSGRPDKVYQLSLAFFSLENEEQI